jgi:hypothetical protein
MLPERDDDTFGRPLALTVRGGGDRDPDEDRAEA